MKSQYEQALIALAEKHKGTLTPDIVVRAAQPDSSPLHDYFDWDDREAAKKWRLEQARELIRSVHVSITTENVTVAAPYFLRDPDMESDEQGYATVASLRTSEDRARAVVLAEFSRAAGALSRAKAVATALNLVGEIESLERRLARLSKRAGKDDRPQA